MKGAHGISKPHRATGIPSRIARASRSSAAALLASTAVLLGGVSCRRNPVAAELERLTGCRTRVVWCQDVDQGTDLLAERRMFTLMGFDSGDNRGERVILDRVSSYARPMVTPRGDRIVFSDRQQGKFFIVDWKGKHCVELGTGFAVDVWQDPNTGVEWVYYGSEPILTPERGLGDKTYEALLRLPLDRPGAPELAWDKTVLTELYENNIQLSSDGRLASLITPAGLGVAGLPNSDFQNLGRGCWPSLAPGPRFLFWHFNGDHRRISIYEAEGANRRDIPINTAPGIDGLEVFHPRWSNDPRFMGMDGPLKIAGGGPAVEVYVGKFNGDWTAIEDWVQVTHNARADFFVDVWVESGLDLQPGDAAPAAAPPADDAVWPANAEALAFLWVDKSAGSGMRQPSVDAPYCHTAQPRGLAHYGRHSSMALTEGAFVAVPGQAILPDAFKASHALTLSGVIVPAAMPPNSAATILAFADTQGRADLTLRQRGAALSLQLHGAEDDELGEIEGHLIAQVPAGRPVHLLIACGGDRLNVYLDGERIVDRQIAPLNFAAWSADRIVFGSAPDASHDWRGSIACIAVYSRRFEPSDATADARLLRSGLQRCMPAPQSIVTGTLVRLSEIPEPASIVPYRRALAVNVFDATTEQGAALEAPRINVAQWIILDDRIIGAADRVIGATHTLTLEPFESHAELQSERLSRDAEDLAAPLYYDINSAWEHWNGGNHGH